MRFFKIDELQQYSENKSGNRNREFEVTLRGWRLGWGGKPISTIGFLPV
jgi:hypothetical protein